MFGHKQHRIIELLVEIIIKEIIIHEFIVVK